MGGGKLNFQKKQLLTTLRILWDVGRGVKLPPVFFFGPKSVMNGGSGISIGGVRILRVVGG